jgi:hypothetical protein
VPLAPVGRGSSEELPLTRFVARLKTRKPRLGSASFPKDIGVASRKYFRFSRARLRNGQLLSVSSSMEKPGSMKEQGLPFAKFLSLVVGDAFSYLCKTIE